jgi:anthranilate/para-aminobenzoate synthase component I
VWSQGRIHFNSGAGIVADSNPAAEYEETTAKARGFLAALAAGRSQKELA